MSVFEQTKETVKEKGLLDKDSDYGGMIGKSLIELMEVFSKQGHSGFSAHHVANLFHELVKHGGHLCAEDEKKAMDKFVKENYPEEVK